MTYLQLADGGSVDCSGNEVQIKHITIKGIAHALSNITRFSGNADRGLSVAQHSLFVATLARHYGYSVKYALLHDASEIVTSDIPGPLKTYIPELYSLERRLQRSILKRFGVDFDPHIKKLETQLLTYEVWYSFDEPDVRWSKCPPDTPESRVLNMIARYSIDEVRAEFTQLWKVS